jgi:hypothetical protein
VGGIITDIQVNFKSLICVEVTMTHKQVEKLKNEIFKDTHAVSKLLQNDSSCQTLEKAAEILSILSSVIYHEIENLSNTFNRGQNEF